MHETAVASLNGMVTETLGEYRTSATPHEAGMSASIMVLAEISVFETHHMCSK
jgi:plastocyanin